MPFRLAWPQVHYRSKPTMNRRFYFVIYLSTHWQCLVIFEANRILPLKQSIFNATNQWTKSIQFLFSKNVSTMFCVWLYRQFRYVVLLIDKNSKSVHFFVPLRQLEINLFLIELKFLKFTILCIIISSVQNFNGGLFLSHADMRSNYK